MSVVNCKVKFIRPEYKNLKEWIDDENNAYIGRGGVVFIDKQRYPKQGGLFCNPFKVGKDGTREEVIEKFKQYITTRLEKEPLLKEELLKLKGRRLGCWCHPEPCHGDVLLQLINIYSEST
jgi:hypothetical protein